MPKLSLRHVYKVYPSRDKGPSLFKRLFKRKEIKAPEDFVAVKDFNLEVDDGELAGDNRVTDNFMTEYENYIQSSDIVFGRSFEIVECGNAGYRVFFYEHGIVGILLIFMFYTLSLMYTPNKRAFVAVFVVVALYFWATAFMTWVYVYMPLYAAAYSEASTDS